MRGIRRGRKIAIHEEHNRVGVIGANATTAVCAVAIDVVEVDFLVVADAVIAGIDHDIAQDVANSPTERPRGCLDDDGIESGRSDSYGEIG